MKKILLIVGIFAFTCSIAQQQSKLNPSASSVSCINLGQSMNVFGSAFSGRTQLYADPDLNIVTLTRRSLWTSASPHGLFADISIDGGNTFTTEAGPMYTAPSDTERARYPQGVIFKNPQYPTIVDSAFIAYYAPLTSYSTTGTSSYAPWPAEVNGITRIGTPMNARQTITYYSPAFSGCIPDNEIITPQGIIWNIDKGIDAGTKDYNDSIIISKGIWNPVKRDFDYTRNIFPFSVPPFNSEYIKTIARTGIAFSKNGQTGYFAVLANEGSGFEPDAIYYPIVFKTTDGGNTWSLPIRIHLDSTGMLITGHSGNYSTAWELDLEVDVHDNLHMLMACSADSVVSPTQETINVVPGSWGIFDVFTPDGGIKWKATLLATPETFRGTFGGINEDSRPQICANKNRDKLFFCWFDTDIIAYGSDSSGNVHPDMHWRGLDALTNTWSPGEVNATAGTCAAGECTFGLVANYGFESGSNFTIPVSYQKILTDNMSPTQHVYLGNNTVSTSGWSSSVNVVGLATDGSSSSVTEINNSFSVFPNYPNPFSGTTSFDISHTKPLSVSVEVSDMFGEIVLPMITNNLPAGKQTIAIDAKKLSPGIYFYRVKTEEFSITKKMVVM